MKGLSKKLKRLLKRAARHRELKEAVKDSLSDMLLPNFSSAANPVRMVGCLQMFQMYRNYQRNIDDELFAEVVLPQYNAEIRKLLVHLEGILGFLKQKEERRLQKN